MEQELINKKVKANAVSAYLLLFVSIFFLLNKVNPYINNDFVKKHVKTAFFIHLLFLPPLIIFIFFGIFNFITFLGFSIDRIIASTLFSINFGFLIYGIYKANNGETLGIGEIIKITKSEKLIDLNKDQKLDEKDKLTVIISYIPFLSYIVYGNFENNQSLRDTTKFNFIISFIITIIYISGKPSLGLFLLLIYIIFIVFSSIILITKNEVISFNLNFIPRIKDFENYIKTLFIYIKNYIKNDKDFIDFNVLLNIEIEKANNKKQEEIDILAKKEDTKLPKVLIYIPIINIIFLFSLETKQRNHIINGLSISILSIIIFLNYGYSNIFYLLLFPICFGIGFLKTNIAYKMPFIYHLYNVLILLNGKIKRLFTKTKEIKNTTKEIKFVALEKKQDDTN